MTMLSFVDKAVSSHSFRAHMEDSLRTAARACAERSELSHEDLDQDWVLLRVPSFAFWSPAARTRSEWYWEAAYAYLKLSAACGRSAAKEHPKASHVKNLLTVERRLDACVQEAIAKDDFRRSCWSALAKPEKPDEDL
jgi:hypothetical protein